MKRKCEWLIKRSVDAIYAILLQSLLLNFRVTYISVLFQRKKQLPARFLTQPGSCLLGYSIIKLEKLRTTIYTHSDAHIVLL